MRQARFAQEHGHSGGGLGVAVIPVLRPRFATCCVGRATITGQLGKGQTPREPVLRLSVKAPPEKYKMKMCFFFYFRSS